jgi:deazaflavin-dependent oxidoreductase (nitroreductase family)
MGAAHHRRGVPVSAAKNRVLGLRGKPGVIALTVFRLMPVMYRLRLGRLFGHTFLLLSHRGRKSGRVYQTALKVLGFDRGTSEAIVVSVYGATTDWMRNIEASPAVLIQIGGRRFVPRQRFLTEDEAFAAAVAFRTRHPRQLRLFSLVLGWGSLATDTAVREFVRTRPFVAFTPAPALARVGS